MPASDSRVTEISRSREALNEGIQQLARALGRLILVSTEQTAAARTLDAALTLIAHVRREGHLDEQEDDENHEALDEDRGDDLEPRSSPSMPATESIARLKISTRCI